MMTITFAQAGSATSSKEKLYSAKHDNCHCIVIMNTTTRECQMLHVWEAAHLGLSAEQQDDVEDFLSREGSKIAVRVLGSFSYVYDDPEHEAKAQLQKMGVNFIDDLSIKTGQETWAACFDPLTHRLEIATDRGVHLYENTLFRDVSVTSPTNPDNVVTQPSRINRAERPHTPDPEHGECTVFEALPKQSFVAAIRETTAENSSKTVDL